MIHGMEKPDLQRAVTEVHSVKFTKYKGKGDLGFGYNCQYKDSLASISALSDLIVIIWNHCIASPNSLLKWCRVLTRPGAVGKADVEFIYQKIYWHPW